MTTILNGTTIVNNRDGQTIDSYIGSGNNSTPGTTNIVRSAGKTIAILQPASASAYACNLPSNAEVGDSVDIYVDPTNYSGGWFYLPSGDTLLDGVSDRGGFNQSAKFIKVSSNLWALSST